MKTPRPPPPMAAAIVAVPIVVTVEEELTIGHPHRHGGLHDRGVDAENPRERVAQDREERVENESDDGRPLSENDSRAPTPLLPT